MGTKLSLPQTGELKPSATLKLTEEKGNFIKGTIKGRFENKMYPGKYNYLIVVDDLQGTTGTWDKENKVEIVTDVKVGETVFVRGTSVLDRYMDQVADGSNVTITYTGKGKAQKGRRAPYLFDVEVN